MTDLEATVDFPDHTESVRNELVIPGENDIPIVYLADASLRRVGIHLVGEATLSKYLRTESTKSKLQVVRLFPPRFEREDVTVVKDIKQWSIESGYFTRFFSLEQGFVDYQKVIIDRAAEHPGLKLSRQLLEVVFGPIEQRINELYAPVKVIDEYNKFQELVKGESND